MKKNTIYSIDQQICTYCGGCAAVCPVMTITIEAERTEITEKCIACGNCEAFCPVDAISHTQREVY